MPPLRVTVWNEYLLEIEHASVGAIYPDGIHGALAEAIREGEPGAEVTTATLRQRDHGLSLELLERSDVLVWWGHMAHDQVADAWVERVQRAVLEGLGLVVLHSAHESRVFRRLLGTSASLRWRVAGEKERLWSLEPAHPILEGVPERFELEPEEMYGERFDVPPPEELLMLSWFRGGEVFRSLCTWRRGHGRIVYFRPGHETYPTYHHAIVRRIVTNACRWARRRVTLPSGISPAVVALEGAPEPTKERV